MRSGRSAALSAASSTEPLAHLKIVLWKISISKEHLNAFHKFSISKEELNALRKFFIYEMFSFNQFSFLGNVIAQFQAKTGKSVNYPCFLHNYFEMVPSEVWPCKEEIMESISHHLPKSFAARRRAKKLFHEWRCTISV